MYFDAINVLNTLNSAIFGETTILMPDIGDILGGIIPCRLAFTYSIANFSFKPLGVVRLVDFSAVFLTSWNVVVVVGVFVGFLPSGIAIDECKINPKITTKQTRNFLILKSH